MLWKDDGGEKSTLALLVAGVAANDVNAPLALDHLAVFANTFDAGPDFHFYDLFWFFSALGSPVRRRRADMPRIKKRS